MKIKQFLVTFCCCFLSISFSAYGRTSKKSLIPHVETFVCMTEPSKLANCTVNDQKSVGLLDNVKNFLLNKVFSLTDTHSTNATESTSSSTHKIVPRLSNDSRNKQHLQDPMQVSCTHGASINLMEAYMTNKNKYKCPPLIEQQASQIKEKECKEETRTFQVVKDRCHGKQTCVIDIKHDFDNICECIENSYLHLKYSCVTIDNKKTKKNKSHLKRSKRNILFYGGRPFKMNFIDPFYDNYPGFYTGPLGISLMQDMAREPFPFNYEFYLDGWHGWRGWGGLMDYPNAFNNLKSKDKDKKKKKKKIRKEKPKSRQKKNTDDSSYSINQYDNSSIYNNPNNGRYENNIKRQKQNEKIYKNYNSIVPMDYYGMTREDKAYNGISERYGGKSYGGYGNQRSQSYGGMKRPGKSYGGKNQRSQSYGDMKRPGKSYGGYANQRNQSYDLKNRRTNRRSNINKIGYIDKNKTKKPSHYDLYGQKKYPITPASSTDSGRTQYRKSRRQRSRQTRY